VPGLWETPELGFNYAFFAANDTGMEKNAYKTFRGFMGARLTTTGILRPGLFGHVGLARLNGTIGPTTVDHVVVLKDITHMGFTWDGGLSLDLALGSHFELGARAAYTQIHGVGTRRPFQWFDFGAQMCLLF
jgi:hypothetical protein